MQKTLKILIISDAWHPQINGVVRTYEHLAEELVKMGHDVKVIGPDDFKWKLPLPNYPEIRLCLFPSRRLSYLIGQYKPDAIHLSVEGPLGWAGRKYCKKRGLKFSTSYHTQFPEYIAKRVPDYLSFMRQPAHRIAKWYVRRFHRLSSAMMVASPYLEEILRRWKFKMPIYRVVRGVNTDKFTPDSSKNVFPEHQKPIALYVGRVAIEKNLEDFLKMDWDGSKVIVGDGPYKSYLEKKYSDAIFLGKKSGQELVDIYQSSDVFVFPSRTDTFGIVLIEALSCGIPVAAYDAIGPKDIITAPYLGCLDDDLSKAAYQAMSQKDPQKCFQHVQNHYTWSIAAKQFLDIIMDKS